MKVNIWQVGYTTQRDFILEENLVCREMGYVEIDPTDQWEESVWELLNWSCWSREGKPENVHSPLDHCNSDIILQIDGTSIYRGAMFLGWRAYSSLEEAVASASIEGHRFYPFSDVKFRSGFRKVENGKAYWMDLDEGRAGRGTWIEVTW